MHRSRDQRLVVLSDFWFPSLTNILFIACFQSVFRWCKMQKTCSLMSWCVISNQARIPFRWCSGELRKHRNIGWIKFCFSAPGSFASILTEVKLTHRLTQTWQPYNIILCIWYARSVLLQCLGQPFKSFIGLRTLEPQNTETITQEIILIDIAPKHEFMV